MATSDEIVMATSSRSSVMYSLSIATIHLLISVLSVGSCEASATFDFIVEAET